MEKRKRTREGLLWGKLLLGQSVVLGNAGSSVGQGVGYGPITALSASVRAAAWKGTSAGPTSWQNGLAASQVDLQVFAGSSFIQVEGMTRHLLQWPLYLLL